MKVLNKKFKYLYDSDDYKDEYTYFANEMSDRDNRGWKILESDQSIGIFYLKSGRLNNIFRHLFDEDPYLNILTERYNFLNSGSINTDVKKEMEKLCEDAVAHLIKTYEEIEFEE